MKAKKGNTSPGKDTSLLTAPLVKEENLLKLRESLVNEVRPSTKSGRPSKQTDKRVAILLDALEDKLPFEIACDYAMVDERTAERWMARDEVFAAQVKYAKSKAQRCVVAKLADKDPKYWLQKRDAKNWAEEKQETGFKVIVNMPDGNKEEL